MYAVVGELGGHGLGPVVLMLNSLGDESQQRDGLAAIGALVESQSRTRFSTRIAPDGTPWPAWSPAYAASRHRGHSLLVAEGHLRDSIGWQLGGTELQIGSNLIYAAIQQAGGEEGMPPGAAAIPAREYLGLSDGDVSEIEDAIEGWIAGLLQ